MFFYEYEMLIDNLNEIIENENKENEKYQKEQEKKYKIPNKSSILNSIPKIPNISNSKYKL